MKFTLVNTRIQDKVRIPEWTAHDLRRTFATQLGEALNIDPVVIEKCLGHKMPRIMATYNKNEMLLQRKEALEQWTNTIERLIKIYSQQLNFRQGAKGYPKEWIDKRLRSIAIRQNLTDEWQERGINSQKDYTILTAEISKATSTGDKQSPAGNKNSVTPCNDKNQCALQNL